jgi:hypothetical protein
MIDNRRFMHGRREINSSEKRDIMVIQTLKSNLRDKINTNKTT